MRHRLAGRKLNRTDAHRKAMLSNMSVSLIQHEIIKTTLARAKELRRFCEPLLTLAKKDTLNARRRVFSVLRDAGAVGKLFTELAPLYKDRPGGYCRIVKCGYRPGDKAPLAYVELLDRVRKEAADEEAPKEEG